MQQRLDLINKGKNPDVLVMTATPIPRSLALTMFGDMTISKLQGKPKNQLPIVTNTMSVNKIEHIIKEINKKIIAGERIYWICQLIEQSNTSDVIPQLDFGIQMDALNRFNSIDIIHGKMKNEQKDALMKQFQGWRNHNTSCNNCC